MTLTKWLEPTDTRPDSTGSIKTFGLVTAGRRWLTTHICCYNQLLAERFVAKLSKLSGLDKVCRQDLAINWWFEQKAVNMGGELGYRTESETKSSATPNFFTIFHLQLSWVTSEQNGVTLSKEMSRTGSHRKAKRLGLRGSDETVAKDISHQQSKASRIQLASVPYWFDFTLTAAGENFPSQLAGGFPGKRRFLLTDNSIPDWIKAEKKHLRHSRTSHPFFLNVTHLSWSGLYRLGGFAERESRSLRASVSFSPALTHRRIWQNGNLDAWRYKW